MFPGNTDLCSRHLRLSFYHWMIQQYHDKSHQTVIFGHSKISWLDQGSSLKRWPSTQEDYVNINTSSLLRSPALEASFPYSTPNTTYNRVPLQQYHPNLIHCPCFPLEMRKDPLPTETWGWQVGMVHLCHRWRTHSGAPCPNREALG